MKRYRINDIFYTLQGEGVNAGRPAVFVRFSGCNAWNGLERSRKRDSLKAVCAAWCDTNFRSGQTCTADGLVDAAMALWPSDETPANIVFTGGEPGLQMDQDLVNAFTWKRARIWVETNGSVRLPQVFHVCLSPKPPLPVIEDQHYDEVKVVFPAIDPLPYAHLALVRSVQPLDNENREANTRAAVEFVKANPSWRLSLQTHKMIGVP